MSLVSQHVFYLLIGTIPSELGKLTALQTLYLYGNRLTGEINMIRVIVHVGASSLCTGMSYVKWITFRVIQEPRIKPDVLLVLVQLDF